MDVVVGKSYHTFNDEQESTPEYEVPKKETSKPFKERQDVFLWMGGVAFIIILIGLIFGIGESRKWDAQSGYTHNTSATSRERFLPEPFVPEPGVKGRYGTDATTRWYYWKLPPDRATSYTRLFAWLCYVGHQTLAWAVLYLAQYHKSSEPKPQRYSTRLTKWNYIAFALHVLFHLLHLLVTHTTYDGLAQDVNMASSQGSVIMVLVFVLLIEYRDRGIVLMWPTNQNQDPVSKKLRFDQSAFAFIRRYHGYGFAWGAIYTFWYHPMENTWGHALGFFHTWIIMLQGSLVYTDIHLNKYWRLLLEVWVTLHGTVVAIQTGGPEQLGTRKWPMFTFGFTFVVAFTQVFGLPFWKRIHWAFRVIPPAIYLAVMIYMYSWIPDEEGRTFVRMQEIVRIPAAYYLGFIYAWLLFYAFLRLEHKIWNGKNTPSSLKTATCFAGSIAVFAIFVSIAVLLDYFDVQLQNTMLMIIFVFVFVTGVAIVCMLLNLTFPGIRIPRESCEKDGRKQNGVYVCDGETATKEI